MYSIEEIKELIDALDRSSLAEIKINAENGGSIKLKKGDGVFNSPAAETAQPIISVPVKSEPVRTSPDGEEKFEIISSPMVGVFYEAPSPDSAPFVSVGQTVSKGDTVCIVEAMKLMNEITAEKSGVVAEVCVKNGEIVEYGQPLFKLK